MLGLWASSDAASTHHSSSRTTTAFQPRFVIPCLSDLRRAKVKITIKSQQHTALFDREFGVASSEWSLHYTHPNHAVKAVAPGSYFPFSTGRKRSPKRRVVVEPRLGGHVRPVRVQLTVVPAQRDVPLLRSVSDIVTWNYMYCRRLFYIPASFPFHSSFSFLLSARPAYLP